MIGGGGGGTILRGILRRLVFFFESMHPDTTLVITAMRHEYPAR